MHVVRGYRAALENGEGMNHQAGPESGGANSTAPEGTTAGETGAAAAESEPARPATGEPRVDAALTLLDGLGELPVTEHAAVCEQVHAELSAALGQLDPESADPDG